MGKSNQDIFAETLLALARANRDILVVTSDSRGSGRLNNFGRELPDQIIEVGIAEQNLVGVAAGLASAGKIVFAVSPASFLTARALEQIKNDVAYADHPVRLVGISAGVSYGALGSTHHSLHDFAVLTAIHNLTVLAPADNFETAAAVRAAMTWRGPLYLRLGKKAMPDLSPDAPFEIGKARSLGEGQDVTFIATGEMVAEAAAAAAALRATGVSCGLVSMPTVKPLDQDAVLRAAVSSQALITVEEHSIHGGLGSQCAALLLQQGRHVQFRIIGIPDDHTVTGNQGEIFRHYGMDASGLAAVARQMLST